MGFVLPKHKRILTFSDRLPTMVLPMKTTSKTEKRKAWRDRNKRQHQGSNLPPPKVPQTDRKGLTRFSRLPTTPPASVACKAFPIRPTPLPRRNALAACWRLARHPPRAYDLNNLGHINSIVTLTNVGNTITVTVSSGSPPNFVSCGIIPGDIIVVSDNRWYISTT